MTITYYCIPADTADDAITELQTERAAALKTTICKGDPSGKITIYPSVIVLSTAIETVVFPDDQNQATLAEVQATELTCLLYTSPSPRDGLLSRMPSSA